MLSARAASHPRLFATQKVGGKHRTLDEQLAAAQFPAFEREVQFAKHLGRKWAFDVCWPSLKIAAEIEGGAFGRYIVIHSGHERRRGQTIPLKAGTVIRAGGRHNTGEGMLADCFKYSWAAILGWLVVRVTPRMIQDGDALTLIREAFRARNVDVPDLPPLGVTDQW